MSAADERSPGEIHEVQLAFEGMRRIALSRSSIDAIRCICENISRKLRLSDCASSPAQLLYVEAAVKNGQGLRYHQLAIGFRDDRPPHANISSDEVEKGQNFLAMLTAGEALRARGEMTKIRELLESDSPDVRLWAGKQFYDIDPETAAAAIHSIFTPLSTRQMLELRRIAREGVPNQPALQEMSDDDLLLCFEGTRVARKRRNFSIHAMNRLIKRQLIKSPAKCATF